MVFCVAAMVESRRQPTRAGRDKAKSAAVAAEAAEMPARQRAEGGKFFRRRWAERVSLILEGE
jgi:hypothetical protein